MTKNIRIILPICFILKADPGFNTVQTVHLALWHCLKYFQHTVPHKNINIVLFSETGSAPSPLNSQLDPDFTCKL